MPTVLTPEELERVLVVTAHPDDVDFGVSGTVAALVQAGVEVSYCICTDGDAGGFDPAVPRSEIPRIRREEQTAAAKAVGVSDVRFLGWSDGRLEPSFELRRDITRVIRQVRPQRVITSSPEYHWDRLPAMHPDHRAAGEATVDCVYPDARNPFTHVELLRDEGLEAWTVRELWLMGHEHADHAVDVTDQFDRKIAALRAHESQTAHMPDLEGFLRQWMSASAKAFGMPDGRLAETYRTIVCPP
ncbi:LmbE family N-acetylglucosaminyl deacetylase [Motilibacter rhizosphaerae]|uniref:LmbE family N-acetylglucosaminyl deacetylase n=1 Tax=Motilibacter rhizosphaerae TaxID=598652 RepID=A0A4Q7NTB1_9ACTN|nr:PIG-L deacetylase family protein [Motilibacter rhizosphaerae]RZS90305.1 LmbE family N-acetylglucosaminyl deacetylase [Motilibacter rhizosphaerae]